MSLYDFYQIDNDCQKFAFGYVYKNLNFLKTIDLIFFYVFLINFISNSVSHRISTTTSSSVHADTSDASTIAVAVSSALLVILLVVLGIFLWRKKKLFGMQYPITFITYISMMKIHEKYHT